MSTPLPSDFPDLDMEAWRAALPMPGPYPADIVARKPAVPKPEPPYVFHGEAFAQRPPRLWRTP